MTITLEEALKNTKNFIAKMKGLNTEINGRPLIDFADFLLLNTKNDSENYILEVSVISNPFDQTKRASFESTINKETGNIDNFKRIDSEKSISVLHVEDLNFSNLLILINEIKKRIVKEKGILIEIKEIMLARNELKVYSKIYNALIFLDTCIDNLKVIPQESNKI